MKYQFNESAETPVQISIKIVAVRHIVANLHAQRPPRLVPLGTEKCKCAFALALTPFNEIFSF